MASFNTRSVFYIWKPLRIWQDNQKFKYRKLKFLFFCLSVSHADEKDEMMKLADFDLNESMFDNKDDE